MSQDDKEVTMETFWYSIKILGEFSIFVFLLCQILYGIYRCWDIAMNKKYPWMKREQRERPLLEEPRLGSPPRSEAEDSSDESTDTVSGYLYHWSLIPCMPIPEDLLGTASVTTSEDEDEDYEPPQGWEADDSSDFSSDTTIRASSVGSSDTLVQRSDEELESDEDAGSDEDLNPIECC
ncbi:hypothetical protein GGR58DRAFT_288806 [Xylaria digitata]|nr:hypothetical protein GGR58DRAFT_288806 [Xylaria digitata]